MDTKLIISGGSKIVIEENVKKDIHAIIKLIEDDIAEEDAIYAKRAKKAGWKNICTKISLAIVLLFISVITGYATYHVCIRVYIYPHFIYTDQITLLKTVNGKCPANYLTMICESSETRSCICYRGVIGNTKDDIILNICIIVGGLVVCSVVPITITYIYYTVAKRSPKSNIAREVMKNHALRDLCGLLYVFGPELHYIGPVLKAKLDQIIDATPISNDTRLALTTYLGSLAVPPPTGNDIYLIDIVSGDDIEPIEIDINLLLRYEYFMAGLGPQFNPIKKMEVLDNLTMKSYVVLFDFIGGIRPNNDDIYDLYHTASAYHILDCMMYCYLTRPELFYVDVPLE
jgi:hypothetical protein